MDREHPITLRPGMPDQIPTPAFRWVAHTESHGDVRLPGRFPGEVAQMHPGLFERFPTFATVTGNATGHNVGPVRRSAVRPWNNVIIGEFAHRWLASTVLALIVVTCIDILTREFHARAAHTDERQQPYDGRQTYRQANTVHFTRVLFDNFHFASKRQCEGALPIDHSQRFKRGIKQQNGFHVCRYPPRSCLWWVDYPVFRDGRHINMSVYHHTPRRREMLLPPAHGYSSRSFLTLLIDRETFLPQTANFINSGGFKGG